MRTVIFLDIDGVLNNEDTTDRICGYRGIESEKVALLKQLVDALDAELVLASTWRSEWNGGNEAKMTEFGHYLNDKLAEYDLKITDEAPSFQWYERAKEVATYLHDHRDIDRVLILDDEDFNWHKYHLGNNWFCTQDPDNLRNGPGLRQTDVDFILANIKFGILQWKEVEQI